MAKNSATELAAKRLKAQRERARTHKAIEALHEVAYASSDRGEKLCLEFFHAVNDLLEGVKPEELPLKLINQREYLAALKR